VSKERRNGINKLKSFSRAIKSKLLSFQRFKFCGDGDCPDYILAIIHSNLCGLSSVKLKVFATNVVKLIISEECVDEEKFSDIFKGSTDDIKSVYSCVRFLLLSAVRHNIAKDVFSVELQQLGLPREHSLALGKVLDEHSVSLAEHLRGKSLTINELADVKISQSDGINCMKMEMKIKNCLFGDSVATKEFNINKSDIPVLLQQLKIIRSKMDELNYENQ
jgi:COMM domain containing 4